LGPPGVPLKLRAVGVARILGTAGPVTEISTQARSAAGNDVVDVLAPVIRPSRGVSSAFTTLPGSGVQDAPPSMGTAAVIVSLVVLRSSRRRTLVVAETGRLPRKVGPAAVSDHHSTMWSFTKSRQTATYSSSFW